MTWSISTFVQQLLKLKNTIPFDTLVVLNLVFQFLSTITTS